MAEDSVNGPREGTYPFRRFRGEPDESADYDDSDMVKRSRFIPHPILTGFGECVGGSYHNPQYEYLLEMPDIPPPQPRGVQRNRERGLDRCGKRQKRQIHQAFWGQRPSGNAFNPTNPVPQASAGSFASDLNRDSLPMGSLPLSNARPSRLHRIDDREVRPKFGLDDWTSLDTAARESRMVHDAIQRSALPRGYVTADDEQRSVSAENLTLPHGPKPTIPLSFQNNLQNNTLFTSQFSHHPFNPQLPVSTHPLQTPRAKRNRADRGSLEYRTLGPSRQSRYPYTKPMEYFIMDSDVEDPDFEDSDDFPDAGDVNGNSDVSIYLDGLLAEQSLLFAYTNFRFHSQTQNLPPTANLITLQEALERSWPNVTGSETPSSMETQPGSKKRQKESCIGRPVQEAISESLKSTDKHQQTSEPNTDTEQPIMEWPADKIPQEVFTTIAGYFSREDICSLRFVNREFSVKLEDAMFRSVVVPLSTTMFSLSKKKGSDPAENSESEDVGMFEKFGHRIYKFGVSFALDEVKLARAHEKPELEWLDASWGPYQWPKQDYTRFDYLSKLENVADESQRMRKAFSNLTNLTELGLSINGGYGWLQGPDMSDNAVWNGQKPPVFGKRFQIDKARLQGWSRYFEQVQANSIQAARGFDPVTHGGLNNHPTRFGVRPYGLFRPAGSPNFLKYRDGMILPGIPGHDYTIGMEEPDVLKKLAERYRADEEINPDLRHHTGGVDNEAYAPSSFLKRLTFAIPNLGHQYPGFPLIFSGINLSADIWAIQSERAMVSPPHDHPLKPNYLTNPQQEWIRETDWVASALMTSYICAIIDNQGIWGQVRHLNLSGISSGMLPNLNRADLYDALPKLTTLTVLVIPDWRHSRTLSITGSIPLIGPETAAAKFKTFLSQRVNRIKGLEELTVGYIGGGERATGMMARNQHVLPAPIIAWPCPSVKNADKRGVLTFETVTKVTFQNCWFSPALLKRFLKDSHALGEIVLDSCSLTAPPGCTRARPFRRPELLPRFPKHLAFLEELRPGTWAKILNRYTPGLTLEQMHVLSSPAEGLFAPEREDSKLRRIELRSCGYVRLSDPDFNQNSLPIPDMRSMDYGLYERYRSLQTVMMQDTMRSPLLGTIVQCIGEDEQQILESGFCMRFGWGDDITRWQCLEDGFFEGGTGRFSGVLETDRAVSEPSSIEVFDSDGELVGPLERD
ncbi:hypothetical protein FQN54_001152 [Arachnomyces sp. PD_36]|nr:hypothetical protein FQN54_001152 [Arachnomyces sp. PD_36]